MAGSFNLGVLEMAIDFSRPFRTSYWYMPYGLYMLMH